MNVGDLQSILTDLGHLLRKVGAGKKADELDGFCRSLEPFSSQKMSELLAQIVRAEEIVRTGLPPAKPKRTAAAKVDPTEIFQRLEALYQHAADSAVSREQILSAFDDLEKMNLPQKQLEQLGPRLHVTQKRLKKDELLKRMRQSVLERKGQAERVLS